MNATNPSEEDIQGVFEELERFAEDARQEGTVERRLRDAEGTPLHAATFYPDEAEELGCFHEDALTPEEAEDAMLDN